MFAKRLVPVLIWRLVGAGGASVWRIVFWGLLILYPIVAVQSIAMLCVCVCVCVSMCVDVCGCVYQCREKKISRSATPILGNVLAQTLSDRFFFLFFPKIFSRPVDGIIGGRVEGLCTRAITNDQAYTDDEQKHWFDKNDYRWLRERGVCTRPALGIYIETNPISHYVLDLSLPVNSQFMLVISRCIYILLNPRKKRPVTQKLL